MNYMALKKAVVNGVGLVGFLVMSGYLLAASFDCAKAGTTVEKLVCSNPTISQQDEQLAQVYKTAMEKAVDKEMLKQAQRTWLKEKRNTCGGVTCLTKTYQIRIQELEENSKDQVPALVTIAQSETVKPRYELTQGKQFQLCRDFLGLINRVEKKSAPNCGLDYPFDDIAKKQGFRDVEWVEVNRKDYKELLKNRYIYREYRVSENTIKERSEKFESFFDKSTARMWTATFDLNGDGKKDKVFKEKTENCGEAADGDAFVAKENGDLDDLAHRRAADNDQFFYRGKSYFYRANYIGEFFGMDSYVTERGLCKFKKI